MKRLSEILKPLTIPERTAIVGALVSADPDVFRRAYGIVGMNALNDLIGYNAVQYDEHVLRFRGYQRAYMAREYRMAGERF